MPNSKILLNKIVQLLVDEWGSDAVGAALTSTSRRTTAVTDKRIRKRTSAKPLARDQISRMQLPEPQASTLLELATRFDRKQFLPSVADIREFLIMSDAKPGAMKDRSDAFKQLVVVLAALPHEQLERLANSSRHSGPSRLGPLSDAIGAAANSLPRHVRQEKEAA